MSYWMHFDKPAQNRFESLHNVLGRADCKNTHANKLYQALSCGLECLLQPMCANQQQQHPQTTTRASPVNRSNRTSRSSLDNHNSDASRSNRRSRTSRISSSSRCSCCSTSKMPNSRISRDSQQQAI